MKKWLFAVALISSCGNEDQCQAATSKMPEGHPTPYSTMHIIQEEGDFVGWDMRVTKLSDQYRITLFCGEGEVEGPVHATFPSIDGVVVIHPSETICGKNIELKFEDRGVKIRTDGGDFEFVPRHKNFIREERWK